MAVEVLHTSTLKQYNKFCITEVVAKYSSIIKKGKNILKQTLQLQR